MWRKYALGIASLASIFGCAPQRPVAVALERIPPVPPAVCEVPSLQTTIAGCVRVASLALGEVHSCARFDDGRVACWGANGSGQLGDGTGQQRSAPRLVTGLTDAIALVAAVDRTCAIRRGGRVVCWGSNRFGEADGLRTLSALPVTFQLGATDESDPDFMLANVRLTPSPVELDEPAIALTLGYAHSCAALASGRVECWGKSSDGELGDAVVGAFRKHAFALEAPAVGLAAGTSHTCARSAVGALTCWGENANGQLGDALPAQAARRVARLPVATAVVAKRGRTCTRSADGTFVCFGEAGECASDASKTPPTPATALGQAKKLSLGSCHFCALRDSGAIDCWSTFLDGVGGAARRQEMQPAADLESGDDHSCALLVSGEIWCWGSNGNGQLGRPVDGEDGTVPVDFQR